MAAEDNRVSPAALSPGPAPDPAPHPPPAEQDRDQSGLRFWVNEMRQLSSPVFILILLFAIASWIDINGVFVELPLMVNVLPEGWDLPSYFVIIIQVANIGPIIYTLLNWRFPTKVTQWPVIIAIISVGLTACILLAFLWDKTSIVNGASTSTALFSLTCFLALVDCTSSVVFLPYMAVYAPAYLTALYVGEGLSGLLPALIGLIQGVGGDPDCVNKTSVDDNGTWTSGIYPVYPDPLFSVGVFYGILACLLAVSLTSFLVLHFHPRGSRERNLLVSRSAVAPAAASVGEAGRRRDGEAENNSGTSGETGQGRDGGVAEKSLGYTKGGLILNVDAEGEDWRDSGGSVEVRTRGKEGEGEERGERAEKERKVMDEGDPCLEVRTLPATSSSDGTDTSMSCRSDAVNSTSSSNSKFRQVILLLLAVCWMNALTNGVLPALQSYSCLPYGNLAYNLANRLSVIANPVACLFGLFVRSKSGVLLAVLTVLGTTCSAYHIALAALSPYPPLYDQTAGAAIAVTTFVLLTAMFSYTKLCCASLLASLAGSRGLFWCGSVTQVGSFVGAVITFVLVNNVKLFTSKYPCT